jgi:hypothetical protein
MSLVNYAFRQAGPCHWLCQRSRSCDILQSWMLRTILPFQNKPPASARTVATLRSSSLPGDRSSFSANSPRPIRTFPNTLASPSFNAPATRPQNLLDAANPALSFIHSYLYSKTIGRVS